MIKIGDNAPDFSLQDTQGNYVTLDQLTEHGKCMILFFPLAYSSVCTDEMCAIRDNLKLYNSLHANIAAISVDSFFTLREFKKSYNLNFTLLSDFNKDTSKDYHCLYEDFFGMKGVSKRAAFVINEDKVIVYAEILDDAGQLPDFKEISKYL